MLRVPVRPCVGRRSRPRPVLERHLGLPRRLADLRPGRLRRHVAAGRQPALPQRCGLRIGAGDRQRMDGRRPARQFELRVDAGADARRHDGERDQNPAGGWQIGAAPAAAPVGRAFRPASGRLSARQAPVVVLRAVALEVLDRLRPRLHALHRAVRHVHRRLPLAVDGLHVGALRRRDTESSRCRRARRRGACAVLPS